MYTYYSIYNNHLFHKQILPLSPVFSKHYTYDNPTIFPKSYKKVPAILYRFNFSRQSPLSLFQIAIRPAILSAPFINNTVIIFSGVYPLKRASASALRCILTANACTAEKSSSLGCPAAADQRALFACVGA